MRQGSILDGILAGFQAYKSTRDWQSQQKSTQLEQERAALGNRMLEQSYEDTMNPMGRYERERPVREGMATEERQNRVADVGAIGEAKLGFEERNSNRTWALQEKELRAKGATDLDILKQKINYMKQIGVYGEGLYPAKRFDRSGGGGGGGDINQSLKLLGELLGDSPPNITATQQLSLLSDVYSGGLTRAAARITKMKWVQGDKDMEKKLDGIDDLPYAYQSEDGPSQMPIDEYLTQAIMGGASQARVKEIVNDFMRQTNANIRSEQKSTRTRINEEMRELIESKTPTMQESAFSERTKRGAPWPGITYK